MHYNYLVSDKPTEGMNILIFSSSIFEVYFWRLHVKRLR